MSACCAQVQVAFGAGWQSVALDLFPVHLERLYLKTLLGLYMNTSCALMSWWLAAGISTKDDVLKMGIDKYNEECRSIVMRCVCNPTNWCSFAPRDSESLMPRPQKLLLVLIARPADLLAGHRAS